MDNRFSAVQKQTTNKKGPQIAQRQVRTLDVRRNSSTNKYQPFRSYLFISRRSAKLAAVQQHDKNPTLNRLEMELTEVYRILYYYEGKVRQLQNICKKYEQVLAQDQNSTTKSQTIQKVIRQLRQRNAQLSSELQQVKANKIKPTPNIKQQKNPPSPKRVSNKNQKTASQAIKIDDYQINLTPSPIQLATIQKKKPKLMFKQSLPTNHILNPDHNVKVLSRQSFDKSSEKSSALPIIRKKDSSFSLRDEARQGSWIFGNLSSRLNRIEKQVESLSKQNERLNVELDRKTNEVVKLSKLSYELQLKLDLLSKMQPNESMNQNKQIEVLPKSMLKQIPKPLPKNQHMQNSSPSAISNVSQSLSATKENLIDSRQINDISYKFSHISQNTIRKLTLHLLREDITYLKLIDTIVQLWTEQNPTSLITTLQNIPYHLSSEQCQQFLLQYQQIKQHFYSQQPTKDTPDSPPLSNLPEKLKQILRSNLPFYKNITIRRDYTLNIQLSNKFKNYETEYQTIADKYNDSMPYHDCEQYLKNSLGLTHEQLLFLALKNYEQNGTLDSLAFRSLGKYFLLQ